MLAYICKDCMTDEELVFQARRAAVGMLDTAENGIAMMELGLRLPGAKDDPKFKSMMAQYRAWDAQARAMLEDLDDR